MRHFKYIIPIVLLLSITGLQINKNPDIPKTEMDSTSVSFYGHKIPDPYQWLEDYNSIKVKNWIEEQNTYTEKILGSFPEGEVLAKRIQELSITSVRQYSPILVNGKLFFQQFTPPQAQPVIAYKTWPNGKVKILIDPNKDKEGTAISDYWPSPDGNYLAFGTALGGNEATTIHILDVISGNILTDTIPYAGGGATPAGLVWDSDGKGFSYVRLPAPGTVPESESQFNAVLYHHSIGKSFKNDMLIFGKGLSKVAEYSFISSENGKYSAFLVHYGDGDPCYVYLRNGNGNWKEVLDTDADVFLSSDARTSTSWYKDNLLLISYDNAPKGKLLSLNISGNVKTVVAEDNWAMNSVSSIKGGFIITKVLGPDWRADQYTANGKFIRTIKIPNSGIGIEDIASSENSDQALITYSGWNTPERWVQYNTKNGTIKTVFQDKPAADYSKVQVTRIDAISKDGTKIPVSIISLANVTPDGKRPAILNAYGGFKISTTPRFIGNNLAWLERGGILAYANIRGGGEFGDGWHKAGMLDKKQNCFDDMYAAAEALVKNNWTNSEHLGIMGGSNGGLLMGAEITQHPEAFKAVVSFVGIYDMLRVELFPNGQYNISEYGTTTREEDFNWLYAYSPYHHVKPNTHYPATLLVTGINDPRVAPWQSRKFAAALQAANSSDNPILLLTKMNEGHGVTASFSQRVGNTTAELTFFAHELGLKPYSFN